MAEREETNPSEPSAPTPDREPSASSTAGERGIPEAPVGTPRFGAQAADSDEGRPVGPTPSFDFWNAVYSRRSIRKFKPDRVPRELVDQVLHAGIWAPSSCNYQMWDFVAVDDPEVNRKLASLSLQMGNAPVNIVVAYGREFSEEGWANVQSASAAIQNMSLAAHVLGLGTFWITQMGDREKVREIVCLPEDRLVIAVLALGYPRVEPKKGPKRRPLAQVAHYNYYAGRAIPSSVDPADWDADLLAIYQRARVLNGLRHNKPRAWEVRAIASALERFVPAGKQRLEERSSSANPSGGTASASAPGSAPPAWLDVLPCTGIVTELVWKSRPGFRFDVVERTPEVAEFVSERLRPAAGKYGWSESPLAGSMSAPPSARYDVVSVFFRLENARPEERTQILRAIASWTKPGGTVIVACVNRRSYHDASEWMRRRRGGPRGVEYVLAPDPNVGPFESLHPREVERMAKDAGLELTARHGVQMVPEPEEIEFRTRNFSKRSRAIARVIGRTAAWTSAVPLLANAFGKLQFLCFRRIR